MDSSHSEKISTKFHHNKNKTVKGIGKTLAVDNETSSSIESVDQFIDYFADGKETVISVNEDQSLSIVNTLHQELESRQSLPIDLATFVGKPYF